MIELTEKQKGYGLQLYQEKNGHVCLHLDNLLVSDLLDPDKDTIDGLQRLIVMTEQILDAFIDSDAFAAYASEWARDQGFGEPA